MVHDVSFDERDDDEDDDEDEDDDDEDDDDEDDGISSSRGRLDDDVPSSSRGRFASAYSLGGPIVNGRLCGRTKPHVNGMG
jgi:hypothetical protein